MEVNIQHGFAFREVIKIGKKVWKIFYTLMTSLNTYIDIDIYWVGGNHISGYQCVLQSTPRFKTK